MIRTYYFASLIGKKFLLMTIFAKKKLETKSLRK